MEPALMKDNLNPLCLMGFQLWLILSPSTQKEAGPFLCFQWKVYAHWVCIRMQRPGRDHHIDVARHLDCLPCEDPVPTLPWASLGLESTVLCDHAWFAPSTHPCPFPKQAAIPVHIPVHIHTLTPCPARPSRTKEKCLTE